MNTEDKVAEKYYCPDIYTAFKDIMETLRILERTYWSTVLIYRDDLTPKQVKTEFWQRVAEHYGFQIKWDTENKP